MWEKTKSACLSPKRGKAEILALVLYVLGITILSCFHEPWFDEAQAWQIARCASFREMVFEVPHYEGHPPLWYLILAPFAKLGAPYEFSIAAVNITFCSAAVALLLFRSPFPKAVRCLIPFTYFFFYQYGVMARPYCLLMLAFMLAAMAYKGRNQHPFRYILSLCLCCLATAYGILIAGGLCMAWVVEIWQECRKNRSFGKLWKDGRTYALCLILALALCLLCIILPADDCYYGGYDNTLIDRLNLFGYFFVVPFDSLFGALFEYGSLSMTAVGFVFDCIGGAVVWVALIWITYHNKKLLTFLLPYGIFIIFCVFKYVSPHHLGVSTMFLVFLAWSILEEQGNIRLPQIWFDIAAKVESAFVKKLAVVVSAIICVLPFLYSAVSAVNDLRYEYGPVYLAEFVKKHGLEDTKIMAMWTWESEGFEEGELPLMATHFMPSDHPEIINHYTDIAGLPVTTLAYFDENIFMNFNTSCPDDLYMHYRQTADPEAVFASWREQGLPEFVFGYCPIDAVYDEETLEGVKYVCIEEFITHKIYKMSDYEVINRIFIREDLLDEYPQFTPVEY